MTVDLSEFRELNGRSGHSGRCGTATFIATLSNTEQAQLAAAFDDGGIQASAIWKYLQRRGFRLGQEAVRTHRRMECACGRP